MPETELLYEEPPVIAYDMAVEQRVDEKLRDFITKFENNKVTDATGRQFIMKDNIMHYISNVDSEPTLRIYIPSHLRQIILHEYHQI